MPNEEVGVWSAVVSAPTPIRVLLLLSPLPNGDGHSTLSPLSPIKGALLKFNVKEKFYKCSKTHALNEHEVIWKIYKQIFHLEGQAKKSLHLEAPNDEQKCSAFCNIIPSQLSCTNVKYHPTHKTTFSLANNLCLRCVLEFNGH